MQHELHCSSEQIAAESFLFGVYCNLLGAF